MFRLLSLACLIVAGLTVVLRQAHGSPSLITDVSVSATLSTPSTGQIAFRSGRYGGGQIYLMNADGSNINQLTHAIDSTGDPAWSPDGQQIAFYIAHNDETSHIFVMDADGSNQHQLTDGLWDRSPAWSPDGQQIAFISNRGTRPDDIFLMSKDGITIRQLTTGGSATSLVWPRDGNKLAFFSKRDGPPHIFTVAIDNGSDIRRLFQQYDQDWGPQWSPDGQMMAFIAIQNDTAGIYLADSDGANPRRIVETSASGFSGILGSLSWSPDGKQLAYSSSSPVIMTPEPHGLNDGQICILTIETAKINCITDKADNASPAWRPNLR